MNVAQVKFARLLRCDFSENTIESEVWGGRAGAFVSVESLEPGDRPLHKLTGLHQDLSRLQNDWQEMVTNDSHVVKERKPANETVCWLSVLVFDDGDDVVKEVLVGQAYAFRGSCTARAELNKRGIVRPRGG